MKKLEIWDELVEALGVLIDDYPLGNHQWWEYPALKRAHDILAKAREMKGIEE